MKNLLDVIYRTNANKSFRDRTEKCFYRIPCRFGHSISIRLTVSGICKVRKLVGHRSPIDKSVQGKTNTKPVKNGCFTVG